MPLSPVERAFVREGGRQERYVSERIKHVVEVANVGALGKLVALQFLFWVQHHPTGVISLPTGTAASVPGIGAAPGCRTEGHTSVRTPTHPCHAHDPFTLLPPPRFRPGRTPEMFIAYLKHYRQHWTDPSTQAELLRYGLEPRPAFPDTSGLRFVQLDEFMPMVRGTSSCMLRRWT